MASYNKKHISERLTSSSGAGSPIPVKVGRDSCIGGNQIHWPFGESRRCVKYSSEAKGISVFLL